MPKGRHLSWVWGRKPPVTTLWTRSSDHLFLAPWNNLEPYKSHDHVNKSKTTSFSHLQRSLFFFLKLTDQKKKFAVAFWLYKCVFQRLSTLFWVLTVHSGNWWTPLIVFQFNSPLLSEWLLIFVSFHVLPTQVPDFLSVSSFRCVFWGII